MKKIIDILNLFNNNEYKYFLVKQPKFELYDYDTFVSIFYKIDISIFLDVLIVGGFEICENMNFNGLLYDGGTIIFKPFKTKKLALKEAQSTIDSSYSMGDKDIVWINKEFMEVFKLKFPDNYLKETKIEKIKNLRNVIKQSKQHLEELNHELSKLLSE